MPYIDSVTTVKLDKEKMVSLKSKLGEAICKMPGKSEEWLFLRFQDGETLYFKGQLQQNAAVIEVKLLGGQEMDVKDNFTSIVSEIFESELNIPKENIYVIFYEVEKGNWGWNGSLF